MFYEKMRVKEKIMCNDISFCANAKCERTDCRRHMSNVPQGIYSMSQFNDNNGENCGYYWSKN